MPLESQTFESEIGEPGWLHWWRETTRRGGDDYWLTRFVVLRLPPVSADQRALRSLLASR